jgi:hypothetical protein
MNIFASLVSPGAIQKNEGSVLGGGAKPGALSGAGVYCCFRGYRRPKRTPLKAYPVRMHVCTSVNSRCSLTGVTWRSPPCEL